MPLRPDTLALTTLLALMTALGPLSTDMYLPSLPAMAVAFETDAANAQLTLSTFMLGMAIGMLIYGPIADRFGRRPVLVVAMGVFVLASLACIWAPDIFSLAALRFIQAVGASGPVVIGRSIVRDLYSGARAGQELARMGTIMGLVPAVAPVLGGLLHNAFGWQSNFMAMGLIGLIGTVAIVTSLPETAQFRQTARLTPFEFGRIYVSILKEAVFLRYAVIAACAHGSIFAFISGSSFVLQDLVGLTPIYFAFCFTGAVLGYMAGTVVGRHLVGRFGIETTLLIGALTMAVAGAAGVFSIEALGLSVWSFLLPVLLTFAGVGITLPQSQAGGLTPFPERAGAASSMIGFFQMAGSAFGGVVVGHGLGTSARPVMFMLLGLGITALFAYLIRPAVKTT